ncbi:MAG: 50S ribosomal protein L18Ae [Promethearchaeota archaeon]
MGSEVKIYKISGKYMKLHQHFSFTKYCRAMNKEDALENILSIVTSQRILRRKIEITENVEVSAEECPDLFMKELANL